jgi:hypothetical protein
MSIFKRKIAINIKFTKFENIENIDYLFVFLNVEKFFK